MAVKRKVRKKETGTLGNIWSLLYNSGPGRIFLFIFFWVLVLSLNILISENFMDKFLILTGIEILVFTVIVWVYYLFRNK